MITIGAVLIVRWILRSSSKRLSCPQRYRIKKYFHGRLGHENSNFRSPEPEGKAKRKKIAESESESMFDSSNDDVMVNRLSGMWSRVKGMNGKIAL